jgi:hypothetical protein
MISREVFNTFQKKLKEERIAAPGDVPTLSDILDYYHKPLSPTQFTFGVRERNNDLVGFDTTNPQFGSFLVTGDHGSGKNELAKLVALKAGLQFTYSGRRDRVQIDILSDKPQDWTGLSSDVVRIQSVTRGSIDILREYDTKAPDVNRILVLDSLPRVIEFWTIGKDREHFSRLAMILKSGYTVIASMNIDRYSRGQKLFDHWVHFFPTRIFGYSKETLVAEHLGCPNAEQLLYLLPSVEYRWVSGGQAFNFWAPRVG